MNSAEKFSQYRRAEDHGDRWDTPEPASIARTLSN